MARREIVGVRIKLATPERIREISSGEVKKPETINYRTLRPEKDGLFCERIFGPTRSYECACGKYKRSGPKFRGIVCDRCGVEVTDNRVRRERMGHIELAAPVVHIWYLRGIPSRLSLLLGTSAKDLEKVVYFAPTRKKEGAFKVVADGRRPDLIRKGAVISESEMEIHSHYDPKFRAEEAFVLESVDNIPAGEGDVLTAQQVDRFRTDYGEEIFKVEPAFELLEDAEDLPLEKNGIVSESEKQRLAEQYGGEPPFGRALINGSEAFIVTAALKLPFAKGNILSKSELDLFQQKYPGRFSASRWGVTIDDPCYIVIEQGGSPFARADVIYDRQQNLCRVYDKKFEAGIGAEGVQTMLSRLDLDLLTASLREEVGESTGQKKRKLVKRLQVAEDFRKSMSSAQSMILEVLPVIPPDLRPLVQLDGGRFATSDLNDLYRRVINRNNRLKKLQELRAPEIIIRNEKRMLQESTDALIDNGRMGKAVLGVGNRPLKSLTDLLRGKKGRFRQNLLGKRVDYSGRSVIVIGPQLKIYQCGLPKQMALELFKPFVIRQLVERQLAPNVKSAKRIIERGREEIWGILEEIIRDHPVMLNRAPTLHRLGIQAFEPVLMEGKAIRLHPMVCTAFNADFDGDQMAVHVPLSIEAQAEARLLMLSANNLLSPASGRPVVTPTQDIVLGIYYLTDMREGLRGDGMYFSSVEDILSALDHEAVHLNARVWLKVDPAWAVMPAKGRCQYRLKQKTKPSFAENLKKVKALSGSTVFVETSPGRALFNSVIAAPLRYVNAQFDKTNMGRLLDDAYDKVDRTAVVEMLDAIKSLGYRWAAKSGISFGVGSVIIPSEKETITAETMEQDELFKKEYEMGVLTQNEYLFHKDKLWSDAARRIADSIAVNMDAANPVRMMVDSGARGSRGQMGQMAGIRGLMSDPSGRIIDYPITANFREGMNMLEYFISTHGARKGLADTALRTAKSGYLTRRLVDVAQDLIITEHDCGTDKGICISALQRDGKDMIPLRERIAGRIALRNIRAGESNRILVKKGALITYELAAAIDKSGVTEVWVRSPLACALKRGLCQKCYGMDLASRHLVAVGEAVGVVAAQSIGEPGTQLTMRTFHTGGVRLTGEDITQGLPRIEQLFEVRRPRKVAFLAGIDGTIEEIRHAEGKRKVVITPFDPAEEPRIVQIPAAQELKEDVAEGLEVESTTRLTEGNIDPQQLLEVSGIDAVQHMLVDEIQEVYRSQGVSINNKHIEVILRKVAPLNRVKVIEEGDTSFVAGDLVWYSEIEEEEKRIERDNENSVSEAVRVFKGDRLKKIEKANEETSGLLGKPLDEAGLWLLLTPGMMLSEIAVEHEGRDVDVVVGEAAFRKQMEGLELVSDFSAEETEIPQGTRLSAAQLREITSHEPKPLLLRDRDTLDKLVGVDWLAERIADGGEVLLEADTLITREAADVIAERRLPDVKVWHNVEQLSVADMFQNDLMNNDNLWGRTIFKAADREGNPLSDIPLYVDARIVRGLAEGEIAAIETEEEGILTRRALLHKFLTDKLYGKVLLSAVYSNGSPVSAEFGQEIGKAAIDAIVDQEPTEIFVRPISAKAAVKQLIRSVTFVRKLREKPDCKPFIHGITKAALATDSFLSAASFQQTAQILAGAAVKGQIDPLHGLKENVIIGHLVPAGTGAESFRKIEAETLTADAGAEDADAEDAKKTEKAEKAEEAEEAEDSAETAAAFETEQQTDVPVK
ncbi:MAG: DNA-directed RNA polymerase subunit beta' [Synergistaceae bacterium]|jgi:DNA-directed RNA polymerase subunit beta'|nr:DNA-directed RNA polymerase subunit beta' [Synergistaceae bacterium]